MGSLLMSATRGRIAGLLSICVCCFVSLPSPAIAQGPVWGKDSIAPVTIVRMCGSLTSVGEQKRLSAMFGTMSYTDDGLGRHLHSDCGFDALRIWISQEAQPIRGARTWTPTFDTHPTDENVFDFDGVPYIARYSMKLQDVKYYPAKYQAPTGKWHEGYVEIPEAPYFAKPQR